MRERESELVSRERVNECMCMERKVPENGVCVRVCVCVHARIHACARDRGEQTQGGKETERKTERETWSLGLTQNSIVSV